MLPYAVQPGHAWLTQHYKWGLDRLLLEHGHSHAIIIEDDMLFSPDFLQLFEATAELLEADSSLWCISSWNDNGLKHFDWDAQRLVSPAVQLCLRLCLHKMQDMLASIMVALCKSHLLCCVPFCVSQLCACTPATQRMPKHSGCAAAESRPADASCPGLQFRTSYFPGLGWMMRRELWAELSPKFPRQAWDHWMRLPSTAQGTLVWLVVPQCFKLLVSAGGIELGAQALNCQPRVSAMLSLRACD